MFPSVAREVIMAFEELHVVTGAFGYSGKYIAARLLDAGHRVRTLTDSPPAGATRLSDWAREHAATLGTRYANELTRRRDRRKAYGDL
jgi:nucleoside-diphosphate-sugar epimerase